MGLPVFQYKFIYRNRQQSGFGEQFKVWILGLEGQIKNLSQHRRKNEKEIGPDTKMNSLPLY